MGTWAEEEDLWIFLLWWEEYVLFGDNLGWVVLNFYLVIEFYLFSLFVLRVRLIKLFLDFPLVRSIDPYLSYGFLICWFDGFKRWFEIILTLISENLFYKP